MWYILGWNPASIQVQREPWWEAFCVILLTSQPTNQLTDMGEYIASLAEVIVTLVPWQNVTFALPVSIKPNGYVKAICGWVYIWRRRELTAHTERMYIFQCRKSDGGANHSGHILWVHIPQSVAQTGRQHRRRRWYLWWTINCWAL